MKMFFADDSKHKGARKGMGSILSFGGHLFDHSEVRKLSDRINEILTDNGVPLSEEVKWSPRKDSWIAKNLHGAARLKCYREILEAARDAGGLAIVLAMDSVRAQYTEEGIQKRCVQWALERVSTHMEKSASEAIVIADRPSGGPKEADQFMADFIDYLESPHNYMEKKTFGMQMLTAPSPMFRQLQVADLVVSITTAMVSGNTKYASEYFDIIKDMMLKNYLGYAGGTGLKVYPDSLTSLYHWVLGETTFAKVRNFSGITLPRKGYLYFTDDGMGAK